jgi:hypothetical protein
MAALNSIRRLLSKNYEIGLLQYFSDRGAIQMPRNWVSPLRYHISRNRHDRRSELGKCVAVLNTDNGAGHPKEWKVEGITDLGTL